MLSAFYAVTGLFGLMLLAMGAQRYFLSLRHLKPGVRLGDVSESPGTSKWGWSVRMRARYTPEGYRIRVSAERLMVTGAGALVLSLLLLLFTTDAWRQ
jgi:hypothetical protein